MVLCAGKLALAASLLCASMVVVTCEVQPDVRPVNAPDIVLSLLENYERSWDSNGNMYLSLLFGHFLVNQATLYFEPTRLDKYLYYVILKKIKEIRTGIEKNSTILDTYLLQKNVITVNPLLKRNYIDKSLEHKSIMANYSKLVDEGYPKAADSDYCLRNISRMTSCNMLAGKCLFMVKSEMPTFGYRRMHKLLLIYILRHHKCWRSFANELAYEVMIVEACTQVYREHRAIAELGIDDYMDLYLEQSTICGLFGFSEFVNQEEMQLFQEWEEEEECNCFVRVYQYRLNKCQCTDHMHSLALVYFINAVIMLR